MAIFQYFQDKLKRSSQHFQVALQGMRLRPWHLLRLWGCGWALYRGGPRAAKPVFLHLEPTGACNLKCVMCPRGEAMSRSMSGHMRLDLFQKICREVDPVFIAFVGFGEPLMHPQIDEMVRLCVRQGRNTRISTNAMRLDEAMSRALIAAGLHQIWFSLDSPHKECLESIRRGADFDRIVRNIRTFLRIRNQQGARVNATVNFTLIGGNIADAADMVDFSCKHLGIKPTFARGYGYDLTTHQDQTIRYSPEVTEHLRRAEDAARRYGWDDVARNLETIRADVSNPLDGRGPCYFPYYVTAVSWDGQITPCCLFYDYQMEIGNLAQGHFEEFWNGPVYQRFRREIEAHRTRLPICGTCPLSDVSLHNLMARFARIPGMKYFSRRVYWKIER